MKFKWNIDTKDLQKYLETKLDRPSPEAIRKYFKGFNKMRQENMFNEELDDIQQVYKLSRDEKSNEADTILSILVLYMRKYVDAYDAVNVFDEKIEALEAKLAKDKPKTCCKE